MRHIQRHVPFFGRVCPIIGRSCPPYVASARFKAVSTQVPQLLRGLVDDAAVFPPGSSPLPEAVAAHRVHRAAWYAPMVGPLLVPASALRLLPPLLTDDDTLDVGLIGDTGLAALADAVASVDPRAPIRQI